MDENTKRRKNVYPLKLHTGLKWFTIRSMHNHISLTGVYAAAITPLKTDFSLDLEALPIFLDFLAERGCHGALLLGTTGEGPSFAANERISFFRAALEVRQVHPDFHLLAGTGTPSLPEAIALTHAAFDMGFDGVVVLPPYYYRKAGDEGLYTWFSQVISAAVPENGALFGYHIPAVSGVGLSLDLISRLKENFPTRFAGLKDSSGETAHACQLGERFGNDLLVYTGHDRLLTFALENGAGGCITALANLFSPDLRSIWDAFQNGKQEPEVQKHMENRRIIMDGYPPIPAFIKAGINRLAGFPHWPVRPPLLNLPPDKEQQAMDEIYPRA